MFSIMLSTFDWRATNIAIGAKEAENIEEVTQEIGRLMKKNSWSANLKTDLPEDTTLFLLPFNSQWTCLALTLLVETTISILDILYKLDLLILREKMTLRFMLIIFRFYNLQELPFNLCKGQKQLILKFVAVVIKEEHH